jgi:hypothetical protein
MLFEHLFSVWQKRKVREARSYLINVSDGENGVVE